MYHGNFAVGVLLLYYILVTVFISGVLWCRWYVFIIITFISKILDNCYYYQHAMLLILFENFLLNVAQMVTLFCCMQQV